MNYPIEVYASGVISLGEEVCCDGFLSGANSRVQSHLHSDHMDHFDTSKGMQEIILSVPTHQLLICENNADLPYRRNVKGIPEYQWQDARGSRISLMPSGHMLGAVQVLVVTSDGMRLGYSGDFRWPLSRVIQVDALVVDSTYGSPQSVREFTQGECEQQLISLVSRALNGGPVYLRAHRGTIERALELISTEVNCPIVASPRLCNTADIYRQHGYTIDNMINAESPEGLEISQAQHVIQVYSTGDVNLMLNRTGQPSYFRLLPATIPNRSRSFLKNRSRLPYPTMQILKERLPISRLQEPSSSSPITHVTAKGLNSPKPSNAV